MEPGLLAAGATAWLWDKFGREWVGRLGEEGKKRWEKVGWKEAAERYRQRVIADYGTMRVLGMTEPVTLEGIFTDAYILDRPTALQRHDIETLKRDPGHLGNAKRLAGLEVLRKKHRLFILGKPGAGKTTFMKYVALSAAQGELDLVPIFVSLNAWANSRHTELLPYLAQEFACCSFPDAQSFIESLLNQGKALVLFDGLDEVPQEGNRRADRSRLIHDFARQYHRSPCLITCRTAATDYTFEPFTYVEIADFDDVQIKTFVNKWFRDNGAKFSKFTKEFYSDENKGLRALASTPLLLTLLCLAFDETGYFPKRRVDLYEEALTALLQKWDSSRGILRDEAYKKLSPKRKRQMFARIAYATFERGDYFLREEPLARQLAEYLHHVPPINQEEEIDGKAVLKAIEAQHGILIERARGIYSFSHLTFQEYFTAQHIVENVGKDTLPNLMNHITDPRWREVLLMVASLLDDGDDFFAFFRFSVENLIAGDKQLVELIKWASRKAASANAPYAPAALRSFYLSLDRALARAHALDRARDRARDLDLALALALARDLALDRDRDLDLALALDLDRARDLNRDLAVDRNRARDLARARNLDLARNLARDLARDLDLDLDLARDRDRDLARGLKVDRLLSYRMDFAQIFSLSIHHDPIHALVPKLAAYFEEVRKLTAPFPQLYQALTALPLPAADAPPEAWQTFATEFRALLIRERDIGHEWGWTWDEVEKLGKYLEANLFLLECLDLAYVPNRQAIENSLLLPPGHPAP